MNTLEQIFEEFKIECKVKGLAVETIKTYHFTWNRFLRFMDLSEIHQINSRTVKQYTALLVEKGFSKHTINNYLRHIRVVIYWMADSEQNIIPKFNVKMVKAQTEIKDIFTDDQMRYILMKPSKQDSFIDWRSWLSSNILNYTGMRGITMLRLKWKDVDLKLMTMKLQAKTGARMIPISDLLYKAILVYKRHFDTEDDHYVIGTSTGSQINIRTLQNTMKKYHLSRGIETNQLHQYRRTFITNTLARGVDSVKVARMVGNSVEMIDRHYFGNQVEFIRDVVDFD